MRRTVRPSRSQRGLALVLVLTVIMALALIATPFVLSMIQQERSATVERAFQQAWYGAEGIRNYAIAQMYNGTDGLERHEKPPGADTPYRDTRNEFDLDVRDARLQKLQWLDPKGRIWGVSVQDEQGKINSRTATDAVMLNLRRIIDARIVDIKDYITIFSGRPARWSQPQRIREIANFTSQMGSIAGCRLDSVHHLGVGARIRLSKPGMPTLETEIAQNGLFIPGFPVVRPAGGFTGYENGFIEIEQRHPVNVNTAKRETLIAVLEGLTVSWPTGMTGGQKSYTLSREDARVVAEALQSKPMEQIADVVEVVAGLGLNDLGKAAVIINAMDPTNVLLTTYVGEGTGTVPFCYTSNETITVQARAVVNHAVGTPISSTGFREVVDVAPPKTLTRHFENQYDYERMMGPPRLLLTTPVVKLNDDTLVSLNVAGWPNQFYNYPFGNRMISFPAVIDPTAIVMPPADMTMKPQPATSENFISMRPARDVRGSGNPIFSINHFDSTLEGQKINTVAFFQQWDAAFARMPQPQNPNPVVNSPDFTAGGTEFWIRFDRSVPANAKLFDIRESDTTNRISLEIVNAELVYRITDATQGITNNNQLRGDKGWSEIRAQHHFVKDTWFHIAIYWKGTRYGHMFMLVDGFVPTGAKWRLVEDEDNNREHHTELSAPMPVPPDPLLPVTAVPLKDSSFCTKPSNYSATDPPWTVPLLIGGEVVEYDPSTGQGRRGARGTAWQAHPQNAKVTLFGYASRLRQMQVRIMHDPVDPPIVVPMGNLVRTVGRNHLVFGQAQAAVDSTNQDTDTDGQMDDIDAAINTINFTTPDVALWPTTGFIKIENEAIFYDKLTPIGATAGKFENCQRGYGGTTAIIHTDNRQIELWSVAVDAPDNSVPQPALIQFGDEWFGPVQFVMQAGTNATNFWVGCVSNGNAKSLLRGVAGIGNPATTHGLGEPMCPVVAVRESDFAVDRMNMMRGDFITAIDLNNQRENHRVWNSMREPIPPPGGPFYPNIRFSDNTHQIMALRSPVTRDFVADHLHTRFLKWPSGELIGVKWAELNNPQVTYGPCVATLDEVKNLASPKGNFRTTSPLDVTSGAIMVPSVGGMGVGNNRPAGAVLVGEEIVGFAGFQADDMLKKCKRGWLNSKAEVHTAGDLMFNLTFLPVSALSNTISTDQPMVPIRQPMVGQGYTSGYALIDQEVVGFEELVADPNGLHLNPLQGFDGRGLFRGMFGTMAVGHNVDALVYGIPYRYVDGYKALQFDNRMPHFTAAHTTRGAKWRSVFYEAVEGTGDRNLVPHLFVRADGLGELWNPQINEASQVWHFNKSGLSELNDYVSHRKELGQIEARFMVEYKAQSYWPAHSWKRAMQLKELRFEYERETRVLLHEDR